MSATIPPRAALFKLPVVETATEAYARVFGNPRVLARASLVPFCLSLGLIALGLTVPVLSALYNLIGLLDLLPYTIFGVAWHRLTLLGPVAGTPPLVSGWRRRHWRFLGYLVAVILISSGVSMVVLLLGITVTRPESSTLPAFTDLIVYITFAIITFFMIRLSFVFPAVSVDENYRLRHAWIHTKGQGLRLLCATLIAAAPLFALVWGVNEGLGALLFVEPAAAPDQDSLLPVAQMQAFIDANRGALMLTQTIAVAVGYVVMALMVSVISIAFRRCTGWVPDADGPPLAPASGNGENSGGRG